LNYLQKQVLEMNNLSKSYNGLQAVHNVSLTVDKGEIFGFLGPNGAGKTTTMKCCAGLLRPNGGNIRILGFDLAKQPASAKALLGYVPDNPYLYEKLTGREMVAFVARLYGVSPKGLQDKIESYFRIFEMETECERLIQGYSRGMRQKTALISAFTPFTFLEIAIFGVAPLTALGFLIGAPPSYFVMLLPLIYLYRIIPTALAIALNMALMAALTPRRLYKVFAIVNFLVGAVPFYFFFSGQQELLTRWAAQLANAEFVLWGLPVIDAVRDLIVALMGGDGGIWLPLFILLISIIIFAFLGLAVVQRLYFRNYERLQTAEMRSSKDNRLKQDKAGITGFTKLPIIWVLVLEHWKPAVRNREMLPAGILFIALLFIYVIAIEGFAGGQLWVMLLNVIAVALCAQFATMILFVPLTMATDRFAMQRQYWFYKIAPVEGKTFAGSLYLSCGLPALILALALIIPVNYFTGITDLGILPMVLVTLLIVSSVALQQLNILTGISSIGEEATLFTRIAREVTILYGPLFMLPLAIAFYYPYIGLLSFMHSIPQSPVKVFAILITVVLTIVVTWKSLQSLTTTWHNMEIK